MNNKGFTLIELLAVIIIIGIINFIAVPVVSNIVEETKMTAIKNSAKSILNITEDYVAKKHITEDQVINEKFTFPNDTKLELANNPKDGFVIVKDSNKYTIAISDGKYCATKRFDSKDIEVNKLNDEEVCGIDILKSELGKTYLKSYATKVSEGTYKTNSTEFRDDNYKTKIINIDFTYNEYVSNDAVISWDLSADNDNSIKGWLTVNKTNASYYDLHITSNKNIYANPYSGFLFEGFTNLKKVTFDNFYTTDAIELYLMFRNCTNLTDIDVSSWDVSNVTDMSYMFYRCSNILNLDVSKWDTSKAKNFIYMFYGCSELRSLDVSKFNTSNVTNMYGMFGNCSNITTFDVSKWNTNKVKDTSYMFSSCSKLDSLDLSKWNTSNVTSMNYMFSSCSNLTELKLSNFNTSNVTNMTNMFYYCYKLTSLDLSSFNTSDSTNMKNMFYYCNKLGQINISNKWSGLFADTSVPLTTKVYNIDSNSYITVN